MPKQNKKKIYYFKSFALGMLVTLTFWLALEISTRILVYIITANTNYLKHGLVKQKAGEGNEVERVFDTQGNVLYNRCMRGNDPKNPVNRFGFRGSEISEKKAGVIRIVCLGGSTTYGLNLEYNNSYPKLLQDKLDIGQSPKCFEVINAGIPANTLMHMISLSHQRILALNPDIIILMSIFNNLVTDEKDFSFISIDGEEKNRVLKFSKKIITLLKDYSILIFVGEDIVRKGFRDCLKDIDWRKGSAAIMHSTNVWKQYSDNLNEFFALFIKNNPSIIIYVLNESINKTDYPQLFPPIEKAAEILWNVSSLYPKNVRYVDIANILHVAQNRGEAIWIAPYSDPIHLSRRGNEIIAETLLERIYPKDP